jgi:hypothetical protein
MANALQRFSAMEQALAPTITDSETPLSADELRLQVMQPVSMPDISPGSGNLHETLGSGA